MNIAWTSLHQVFNFFKSSKPSLVVGQSHDLVFHSYALHFPDWNWFVSWEGGDNVYTHSPVTSPLITGPSEHLLTRLNNFLSELRHSNIPSVLCLYQYCIRPSLPLFMSNCWKRVGRWEQCHAPSLFMLEHFDDILRSRQFVLHSK